MKLVTAFRYLSLFSLLLLVTGAWTASAQKAEYMLRVDVSEDVMDPYAAGLHSGARDIVGPVDLDGDGKMEIVVSDYTGGGRAHVIENAGADTWEWVYSTPWVDSTGTTNNVRSVGAGDMDGDGMGEILFFAGRNYGVTSTLSPGLYAYEFNGTDFGTEPAGVYEFGDHLPNRWRQERIEIMDVDGDGKSEAMWGNNGNNAHDEWYIVSVDGDIGSGFETWVEEARLNSRVVDHDPVNRGGGSPYYIGAGDFNGDGTMDLTLHSWNNFNLTTGQATGPDTYEFPDENSANAYLHANGNLDYVAFFGGTVVDIDQDGNDEVFYSRLQGGQAVLLNYDEGENTLEVTEDNVVVNIFGKPLSSLGIGSGDLDNDGLMEVFGTGFTYTGGSRTAGNDPVFIRIAEYQEGDVESHASYKVQELTYSEMFDRDEFNTIERDSSGVTSTYYEDGAQGGAFVSKFAYLGDADGDGFNELAVAFQGIDDSTFVIKETFNPADSTYTRETLESKANENRIFMRVLQGGTELSVHIVDERVILPSDYELSANYPNPFNPSTTFSFTLPLDKAVSVKVYDITGRLVRTLVNNAQHTAGTHEVSWDGTNASGQPVASGTYIYTLEWGQFVQSRTMILLK